VTNSMPAQSTDPDHIERTTGTVMKSTRIVAIAVLMAASGLPPSVAQAQLPGIKRTDLVRQDLGIPGREVIQVLVELGPGVVAPRHSHPGEEVVYVVEGSLEYQLDGRPPVTLTAGETLFIPAGHIHAARNVGRGNGAELATYIVEKGKPLLVPATAESLAPATVPNAAATDRPMVFETLRVSREGAVLFAEIAVPPMNLFGPELVRDLVSLIQRAEADEGIRVLVFKSADPDYFISHVDVTRIKEYREEAAKLTGEPSIALLFRYLSASRLVTIAQIEGRVRGAGSEFVLACDMRFAARESAIFGQPEQGFGVIPGAGGVQHLTRLMGRARALEVMLSAHDFDAELAEQYGWINRALPAAELGGFVRSLAHRIAGFPAAGHVVMKDRVNAIALAPADDFRRDSDLFGDGVRNPEAQQRIRAAIERGFQTREAEKTLGRLLGDLVAR
jgi:enoyl-CoA hydratase/carnithine racemase/quercetin dioxygenase-like cupin family protein